VLVFDAAKCPQYLERKLNFYCKDCLAVIDTACNNVVHTTVMLMLVNAR